MIPKGINEKEKEQIITEMLPYIKYTALRLSWRLPPHLTVEDLMSTGIVGLLEAIERYREGEGKLSTFAKYRIKGAMLDELDYFNPIPKSQKKKMDMVKKICREMENRTGKIPDDEELAEALDLTLDEYYEIIQGSQVAAVINIDEHTERNGNGEEINLADIIPDASAANPLNRLEREDKKQWLAAIIDGLPDREKLILSLYYWDELTMKEIAGVIDMTEGRVCQLHNKALIWLRARMDAEKSIKEIF